MRQEQAGIRPFFGWESGEIGGAADGKQPITHQPPAICLPFIVFIIVCSDTQHHGNRSPPAGRTDDIQGGVRLQRNARYERHRRRRPRDGQKRAGRGQAEAKEGGGAKAPLAERLARLKSHLMRFLPIARSRAAIHPSPLFLRRTASAYDWLSENSSSSTFLSGSPS